jgi:aryl-phospho-beta-D-glucosidase BglC (GH1 family)
MQIRNMDRCVSKARTEKFWIVFVVTTSGDERAGDLWREEGLQRSLVKNWKAIAARYRDVPEIAGYDLLNEPIAKGEDGKAPTPGLDWLQLASSITDAVRSVDAKHVVIVEPSAGAEPWAFANLQPIKGANVVYSVHMYHPHEFTHQGVNRAYPKRGIEYPSRADSPIGAWNKARLSQDLEAVRKFSKQTGIPIYVGEFSAVRWAPKGSRERYVSDLISLFDAEKWAWTYHAWRGWPGWDPENDSDDQDQMASRRNASSSTMDILRSSFKANH